MSFIEIVKVPLWDGVDTSKLLGQGTFDSVDEEIALKSPYASDSPSPGEQWEGLPAGSVVDMSTIRIPENMQTLIGSNLITNGTFDTDTDWLKETGWSISGAKALCDGSQSINTNLYQYNGTTVAGKVYRVEYTLSNYSAGTVQTYMGGGWGGNLRNANGTYVDTAVAVNTSDLTFFGNLDFVGDIDNVTLYEVTFLHGTVKYQYAINGGSLNGTWLTQAQLRSESDLAITDATQSIKIVPQYISDGTQKSTSQAHALVNVSFPEGGSQTRDVITGITPRVVRDVQTVKAVKT